MCPDLIRWWIVDLYRHCETHGLHEIISSTGCSTWFRRQSQVWQFDVSLRGFTRREDTYCCRQRRDAGRRATSNAEKVRFRVHVKRGQREGYVVIKVVDTQTCQYSICHICIFFNTCVYTKEVVLKRAFRFEQFQAVYERSSETGQIWGILKGKEYWTGLRLEQWQVSID